MSPRYCPATRAAPRGSQPSGQRAKERKASSAASRRRPLVAVSIPCDNLAGNRDRNATGGQSSERSRRHRADPVRPCGRAELCGHRPDRRCGGRVLDLVLKRTLPKSIGAPTPTRGDTPKSVKPVASGTALTAVANAPGVRLWGAAAIILPDRRLLQRTAEIVLISPRFAADLFEKSCSVRVCAIHDGYTGSALTTLRREMARPSGNPVPTGSPMSITMHGVADLED